MLLSYGDLTLKLILISASLSPPPPLSPNDIIICNNGKFSGLPRPHSQQDYLQDEAHQQQQQHGEELVMPGSREEMEEFEQHAASTTRYALKCVVPSARLHLPCKAFLDTLYNRYMYTSRRVQNDSHFSVHFSKMADQNNKHAGHIQMYYKLVANQIHTSMKKKRANQLRKLIFCSVYKFTYRKKLKN